MRRRGVDRDAGSVLLLVPAGFLVVVLLASIAVDHSLVFLRQRQATTVATDVANDLVTAALDHDTFRATGEYHLDPARVDELAPLLAAAGDPGPALMEVTAAVTGPGQVEVVVVARADHIFTKAIPGAPDHTVVSARATATARSG